MRFIPFLLALLLSSPAFAGKADVVDVKATVESPGTYRFDVTIRSDDTGWEKYADSFEVLSSDGTILGTRVLAHPHETEQPFTRELTGVAVPKHVKQVRLRAHDKVEGFGGKEMTVPLP